MVKICLVNKTVCNDITVHICKRNIHIRQGANAICEANPGEKIAIKISVNRKTKVSVKWVNVLFTEAVNSDARSTICFDYVFEIIVPENDSELVISENNCRASDSVKLTSVCATTLRDYIIMENYVFSHNKKNPKTKHTLLQLLFLSGLPLVLAGLIYSFFDFQFGIIVAVAILFFIGTVPSVKSIKKFNKTFDNADNLLKSEISERSDYDKIEHIANEIVQDSEAKGIAKVIAKILKRLIDSI